MCSDTMSPRRNHNSNYTFGMICNVRQRHMNFKPRTKRVSRGRGQTIKCLDRVLKQRKMYVFQITYQACLYYTKLLRGLLRSQIDILSSPTLIQTARMLARANRAPGRHNTVRLIGSWTCTDGCLRECTLYILFVPVLFILHAQLRA